MNLKLLGVIFVLTISRAGFSASSWVEIVNTKKINAQRVIAQNTLKFEDHVALKEYFADISDLAILLKQKGDRSGELLKMSGMGNIESVYDKLFIAPEEWKQLIKLCTVNKLFICAEEVRFYEKAIQSIERKRNL